MATRLRIPRALLACALATALAAFPVPAQARAAEGDAAADVAKAVAAEDVEAALAQGRGAEGAAGEGAAADAAAAAAESEGAEQLDAEAAGGEAAPAAQDGAGAQQGADCAADAGAGADSGADSPDAEAAGEGAGGDSASVAAAGCGDAGCGDAGEAGSGVLEGAAVPSVQSAGSATAAPDASLEAAADGSERKLEQVRVLFYDKDKNSFEAFPQTKPPDDPRTLEMANGRLQLDVLLCYSDGTQERAGQAGTLGTVEWTLRNAQQGGVAAVRLDEGTGVLELQEGFTSKVVELEASVNGVKAANAPVFVELVRACGTPASGTAVAQVAVTATNDAGTCAASDPAAVEARSTGTATVQDVPVVELRRGSLELRADVSLVDASGAQEQVPGAQAGVIWQVMSCFDELGAQTATLLARALSVNGVGVVTALGVGNGWVVVRCSALDYPGFAGREVLVRITGNEPLSQAEVDARTVTGAQLVYRDAETGAYRDYNGYTLATSPVSIDTPGGSAAFDVRLTFADGSTALAASLGAGVDYAVRGNAGGAGGAATATMAADGTLAALHTGDATVRIAQASVVGTAAAGTPAYVRISNNDPSVRPVGDQLQVRALASYWIPAGAQPDDPAASWYWRSVPTAGTAACTVPLVVFAQSGYSPCKLSAAVRWSNSATTASQDQDGGTRVWQVVSSTDLEGNPCAPLAVVDPAGTVVPTRAGSGFVDIRCTVELPVYQADGTQAVQTLAGTYRVAVYAPDAYAKSVVLLDEKGNPLETTSVVLPAGKNVYRFGARVTYVEYDVAQGRMVERTATLPGDECPWEATWKVYRTEERAEAERYSQVADGSFHAQSGFARGYVHVSLAKASITGKDLGAGCTVIAQDSMEYTGQVDDIQVEIYHYSDYLNHGDAATPAKELQLTRAQLSAVAGYTTWYTLQRRGDAYSTMYATGVTMRGLLALCGVDPDRLITMAFLGTDGYFAERHSADFILGTQWRYRNYYFHKDLPGLLVAESVSPMLALGYYMKNNAGYEDASDKDNAYDAGFGYMVSDSTFRVVFGMAGPNIRNANQSIVKVAKITIVVEDDTFPAEEEPEPEPERQPQEKRDPSLGEPGDGGTDKQGESNNPFIGGRSDNGTGTDAKHGQDVAVAPGEVAEAEAGKADATGAVPDSEGARTGSATQASPTVQGTSDATGSLTLRELSERGRTVLPPAEIGALRWGVVAAGGLLSLLLAALWMRKRYMLDRLDGASIHT